MRSLCRQHLDLHSHGLRHHQDIRKDDRSVQQARVPTNRLHGDFRGQLGVAAAFEEVVVFANLAEFCRAVQKSAGLVVSRRYFAR